jgi:hypothetical protein
MKNQLKQTPTQDIFDKIFNSVFSELSKSGCEYVEKHPDKVSFRLMGKPFEIVAKEAKK